MSKFIENNNTIIKYANNDKVCLLYAILIAKQCWDKPSQCWDNSIITSQR